jgi:acetylornithine deacetylase
MRPPTLLSLLALASSTLAQDQRPIGLSPSKDDAPSYRTPLLALHKSLVSIPSLSGHEQDVGSYLISYLSSLGYEAEAQPLAKPENTTRFNVLARWPGADRKPRVLLSSHIDTVPPYIPYSSSDSDEDVGPDTVIMGRGSSDAKASVAAQIIALEELRKAGAIDIDQVLLAFVIGEEVDGVGMRRFGTLAAEDGLTFEAGIFGEPTEGKLACGHKGHAACTIKAQGKAGHSGYPWLGKSATEVLVRALVKVLDTDLGSSERFGNTTVNVGIIEGGVAANVISEHASARVAMRVAVGNQTTGWGMVQDNLARVLEEVDGEALSMECGHGYGPIECDCDVDGFEGTIVNYGTDVANLEGDHIRYLYGPGSILVAHGKDENVKVYELETAVEDYKRLIKHALGKE